MSAAALSRSGTNRVALSYRSDSLARARERKSNVVEIRTDSVTLDCEGKNLNLPNHFAFALIGGEPPEEFLRRTGVEVVEKVLTA